MSGRACNIPKFASEVIDRLRNAGYDAFAVGGCVRDTILGRKPSDWDVATSAPVDVIPKLFEKTVPTGVKYGTYTVFMDGEKVEVTEFRRDGQYIDGRKPDRVIFVGDVREDLARRDFTINAMAMDQDGRIIDPFCGQEDLKNKLIRCVGDPDRRFAEDALRMLRALRFAAVLGFDIDNPTFESLKRNAPRCARLSAERVRDELERILVSERPEFVGTAVKIGLLSKYIEPCNIDLGGISALPEDLETRWCVFSYVVCTTGQTGRKTGELLGELRLPSTFAKDADKAAEIAKELTGDPLDARVAISRYGGKLTKLAACCLDCAGRGTNLKTVEDELAAGLAVPISSLDISGEVLKEFGFSGKRLGDTLRTLSLEVTLGRLENKRESLLKWLRERA